MTLLKILLATWGAWFLRSVVLWVVPATVRSTPTGYALQDGHPTKIACERNPSISFWEKTVQPSGYDGGDPIPTSTMFNVLYHTSAPRVLLKSSDVGGTCAYQPECLVDILAQLNKPQAWTVTFPAGQTQSFWGWLRSFEPGANQEGSQPEATYKICVSNTIPNTGAEEGPTMVTPGGT